LKYFYKMRNTVIYFCPHSPLDDQVFYFSPCRQNPPEKYAGSALIN
jgi:hypothetical protein